MHTQDFPVTSREKRDIYMAISAGLNSNILRKSDTKAFQAGRFRSSTKTSSSADYLLAVFWEVLLTFRW